MDTLRGERGGQAGPPRGRVGWAAASVAALVATAAPAAEIDTGREDLKIRWDNTVKYSAAQRLKDPSPALLGNPNNDDGNRNFGKGLVSSRLDLLSELDVVYQRSMGLRVSAAGWYDSVYRRANDNPGFAGGAFPNQTSVPYNRFPADTRRVHGSDAEMLDAFVFGRFDLAGKTTTVRAGRHSLLWGESLFFGANAIAGGRCRWMRSSCCRCREHSSRRPSALCPWCRHRCS